MRFSIDFGLQASLGMTTLSVGEVYLAVSSEINKRIIRT